MSSLNASLIFTVLKIGIVVNTTLKFDDTPADYLSLRIPDKTGGEYSSGGSPSLAVGKRQTLVNKSNQLLVDVHSETIPYKFQRAQPFALEATHEKLPWLAIMESRIPQDNVQPWKGIDKITIAEGQDLCEEVWSSYKFPVEGKEFLVPSCYPKFHRRRDPKRYGGHLLIYRFLYSKEKSGTYNADAVKCFCNYSQTHGSKVSLRPVPSTRKYFYLLKFSNNEYAVLTPQHSTHVLAIVDVKVV